MLSFQPGGSNLASFYVGFEPVVDRVATWQRKPEMGEQKRKTQIDMEAAFRILNAIYCDEVAVAKRQSKGPSSR